MISIQHVDKAFNENPVLQDVSFDIPDGQIFGVFGKSGIGKSTLAKMLCGICPPDAGTITLDDQILVSADQPYDRRLGIYIQMVYQQPYATLDPAQKIGAGFIELIRYHRFSPKGEELSLAKEMLDKVGLAPQILAHLPHQISGGEAQRVAIARCLLFRPKLLILDEPTNGLDPAGIQEMRSLIASMPQTTGATVLISSHILDELSRLATHYGFIDGGRMVKEMSAAELESHCRKCIRVEASSSRILARVLDGFGAEYRVVDDAQVDIFADVPVSELVAAAQREGCVIRSMKERDESLESFYMNLVGGGCHA